MPRNGRLTHDEMVNRIKQGGSVHYVNPKDSTDTRLLTRVEQVPQDHVIFSEDPAARQDVRSRLLKQREDLDRAIADLEQAPSAPVSNAQRPAPAADSDEELYRSFGLPDDEPTYGTGRVSASQAWRMKDDELLQQPGITEGDVKEIRDLQGRYEKFEAAKQARDAQRQAQL